MSNIVVSLFEALGAIVVFIMKALSYILCAMALIFSLVGFWRWPTVASLLFAGNMGFRKIAVANFGAVLLDILVAPLFLLTLCSWRGPRTVLTMLSTDVSEDVYSFARRGVVATQFLILLFDIPCLLLFVLAHVFFWRIPFLWSRLSSELQSKGSPLCRSQTDDPSGGTKFREIMCSEALLGFADFLCVPPALLLLFTMYRIPIARHYWREQNDNDGAERRLIIVWQAFQVLLDIPFFCMSLCVLCSWRNIQYFRSFCCMPESLRQPIRAANPTVIIWYDLFRCVSFQCFMALLQDIPCGFALLLTHMTFWRLPSLYSWLWSEGKRYGFVLFQPVSDPLNNCSGCEARSSFRSLIFFHCLTGFMDVLFAPFGALVLITLYRIPVVMEKWDSKGTVISRSSGGGEEGGSGGAPEFHLDVYFQRWNVVIRQCGQVLLDIPHLLAAVIMLCTWRCIRLVRTISSVRASNTNSNNKQRSFSLGRARPSPSEPTTPHIPQPADAIDEGHYEPVLHEIAPASSSSAAVSSSTTWSEGYKNVRDAVREEFCDWLEDLPCIFALLMCHLMLWRAFFLWRDMGKEITRLGGRVPLLHSRQAMVGSNCRVIFWKHFLRGLIDVMLFPLGLLLLLTMYRVPAVFREWSECDPQRDDLYAAKWMIVAFQAVQLLFDLVYLMLFLVCLVLVWRLPFLFHDVSRVMRHGRLAKETWWTHLTKTDTRLNLFVFLCMNIVNAIVDVMMLPLSILVMLTGYRIPNVLAGWKEIDDAQRSVDEAAAKKEEEGVALRLAIHYLMKWSVVFVEAFCIFCDLPFAILGVVTVVMLFRAKALIEDLLAVDSRSKDAAAERRWIVLHHFFLSFRDWFFAALFIPLCAVVFRAVLCMKGVKDAVTSWANPTPMIIVQSARLSLPESTRKTGMKLSIIGRRADPSFSLLPNSGVHLFIRNSDFWDGVSGILGGTVASVGQTMLPLALTPKYFNVKQLILSKNTKREVDSKREESSNNNNDCGENFLASDRAMPARDAVASSDASGAGDLLELEVDFDLPGVKCSSIRKNVLKLLPLSVDIQVEYNGCSSNSCVTVDGENNATQRCPQHGTLFALRLQFRDFISHVDAGLDVPVVDLETTYPAELRQGKRFCDVFWKFVLLEFLFLLFDIVGICCFVFLHLFPHRAFTFYRTACDGPSRKSLRKRFDAIHACREALAKQPQVIEKALFEFDDAVRKQLDDIDTSGASLFYTRPGYRQRSSFAALEILSQFQNHAESLRSTDWTEAAWDVEQVAQGLRKDLLLLKAFYAGHFYRETPFCNLFESLGNDDIDPASAAPAPAAAVVVSPPAAPTPPHPPVAAGDAAEVTVADILNGEGGAVSGVQSEISLTQFMSGDHSSAPPHPTSPPRAPINPRALIELHITNVSLLSIRLAQGEQEAGKNLAKEPKSWGAVRETAILQIGGAICDLPAIVCACLVVCTGYRIPSLIMAIMDAAQYGKAGRVRKACYWQLVEVFIDVVYMFKFMLVLLFPRGWLFALRDLLYYMRLAPSFSVARCVIDHHLAWIFKSLFESIRGIVDAFLALFAWETIKFCVATIVFGVFSPCVVLESAFTKWEGPGSGEWTLCGATMMLLIASSWAIGIPIFTGYYISSITTSAFGPAAFFFGVMGIVILAGVVVSICHREAQVVSIQRRSMKHMPAFSVSHLVVVAQLLLQLLQLLGLVFATVGDDMYGLTVSEWLVNISNDVFFTFGASKSSMGIPYGVQLALVVALVYFVIAGAPIVCDDMLHWSNASSISSSVSWTLGMQFFGHVMLMTVARNIATLFACNPGLDRLRFAAPDSDLACWSGPLKSLTVFAMVALTFYIPNALMRNRKYNAAMVRGVPVFFPQLYQCMIQLPLAACCVVTTILYPTHRAVSLIIIVITMACCILATVSYSRFFGSAPCSVDSIVVYQTIIHLVVLSCAIVLLVHNHLLPTMVAEDHHFWSLYACGGVIGLGAVAGIVAHFVLSRETRAVEDSIEDVKQRLIAARKTLRDRQALRPSGPVVGEASDEAWIHRVNQATRCSQLAVQVLRLEKDSFTVHLSPLFLSTRKSWVKKTSSLIDGTDFEEDVAVIWRAMETYDAIRSNICCGCCCMSTDEYILDDEQTNMQAGEGQMTDVSVEERKLQILQEVVMALCVASQNQESDGL